MEPPTEIRGGGGADLIAVARKKSRWNIVEFRFETRYRLRHLRQNSVEKRTMMFTRSPIHFNFNFPIQS